MGVILSFMKGPNEPDPVTGLTPREKYLVTSTWHHVSKDLVGNGVQLFLIFFHHKPEYQEFFPFRGVPYNELEKNTKVKAHAANVMYAIASIVDRLNESDVLLELLKKTGVSHRRRKIPEEAFTVLQASVLELLQKGLGSKINKEGLDAWDKTLSVAFKVVLDTINSED